MLLTIKVARIENLFVDTLTMETIEGDQGHRRLGCPFSTSTLKITKGTSGIIVVVVRCDGRDPQNRDDFVTQHTDMEDPSILTDS